MRCMAAAAARVPASQNPWTCPLLQALLYLMGIPSAVPFLEVVAYAGYPFVHVCLSSLVGAAFGEHVSMTGDITGDSLMAGARPAEYADWQHMQI